MPPIGKRQQIVNPTNVSPAEDVVSEDDSSTTGMGHPVGETDSPIVVFGHSSLESTIPSESLSEVRSTRSRYGLPGIGSSMGGGVRSEWVSSYQHPFVPPYFWHFDDPGQSA